MAEFEIIGGEMGEGSDDATAVLQSDAPVMGMPMDAAVSAMPIILCRPWAKRQEGRRAGGPRVPRQGCTKRPCAALLELPLPSLERRGVSCQQMAGRELFVFSLSADRLLARSLLVFPLLCFGGSPP